MNHQDQEIINSVAVDMTPVFEKVKEVAVITDGATESRANEFLALCKREYKRVDEIRKSKVQPLNDHVKWLNAGFANTLNPLQEAIDLITRAMITHRNSQEFKRLEAERKEAEDKARLAVKEGDTAKLAEIVEESKEALTEAPRTVATASGKTSFRKTYEWRVADESKIPRNFFILNEKMVNGAVKAGIKIEGIEITEVMKPVTRL